jgi:hypothetical protein
VSFLIDFIGYSLAVIWAVLKSVFFAGLCLSLLLLLLMWAVLKAGSAADDDMERYWRQRDRNDV